MYWGIFQGTFARKNVFVKFNKSNDYKDQGIFATFFYKTLYIRARIKSFNKKSGKNSLSLIIY